MKELYTLVKTDLRNILKHKFTWVYIIFMFLIVGIKCPIKLYNGDLSILFMTFNTQMMDIFFSLPLLMAVTMNDSTMKFIPNVLIVKLENRKLFFLSQSIAYFCLTMIIMLLGNLKVIILTEIYSGNYAWLYFFRYLGIFSMRLFFCITFIIFLWVMLRKFILVLITFLIITFTSINISKPIFSIGFISGVFNKILLYNDKSIWIGGIIHIVLGIIVIAISINKYDKKLEV
ncbi:hypothetical protein ACFIJ5_18480 (plasmid) [Haloimpatiens sp. FM7330]|uniref:hypothetical protein n=1 Tax=Haloimpatiens sp. FM7330 TaxID=3298610 RepID=UPI003626B211